MFNEDITVYLVNPNESPALKIICPYCNEETILTPIDEAKDLYYDLSALCDQIVIMGYRQCKLHNCQEIMTVTATCNIEYDENWQGEINRDLNPVDIKTSPLNSVFRINKNIPDKIADTFNEAQKCYAGDLYIASAIIIRKVLEEICNNLVIKAENLEKRIDKLVQIDKLKDIPTEYLHELRKFGNDAAHVNQKKYSEFTEKEIKIALNALNLLLEILYENKKEIYKQQIEKLRKCKSSN